MHNGDEGVEMGGVVVLSSLSFICCSVVFFLSFGVVFSHTLSQSEQEYDHTEYDDTFSPFLKKGNLEEEEEDYENGDIEKGMANPFLDKPTFVLVGLGTERIP